MNFLSIQSDRSFFTFLQAHLPAVAKKIISINASHDFYEKFQSLLYQGSQSIFHAPLSLPPPTSFNSQKIFTPEAEVAQRLKEVNSDRQRRGLPSIDFKSVTQEIETIMNDSSFSDSEKKKRIGALRKKLKLGKKDMKKLFTQRLKKIYAEGAAQIRIQLQNTTNPLEKERLNTLLQQYESKASLYNSMFKSFWSKLGGVFKKIGKGLIKIGKAFSKVVNFAVPFFNLLPGLGPLLNVGWKAVFKIASKVFSKFQNIDEPIRKAVNGFFKTGIDWITNHKVF